MLDQCVDLVQLGHDVTLGYIAPGDLLDRYHEGGVRTIRLGDYTVDRAAPVGSALRLTRGLARALAVPADVVVANAYHSTMFAGAVARARRLPLVCHLRLFPPIEFCGQWRIGARAVTRFIAVADAVARAWIARGFDAGAIDVVHDGVDMARFRPRPEQREALRRALAIPSDAFVVLYGGRLDRTKNIEALLRTFAALGLPAARARLLIAGRPVDHATPEAGAAYAESLRALASSLGIADAIQWLGSRPDMPELYAAADVSALFSRDPEPLARATYESLACGTPVIAWRDGGLPEVLTGEFARFLFDGARPEAPVELLRSLIGWRDRDPGFAQRARCHAQAGFSRESMSRGIEQSLRRAVSERRLRRGPAYGAFREAVA